LNSLCIRWLPLFKTIWNIEVWSVLCAKNKPLYNTYTQRVVRRCHICPLSAYFNPP
jgi:hypothetical protein